MAAKGSKIWLVEVNGQQQGPFTTADLMKRVTTGTIPLESRIFDIEVGCWKRVLDVMPVLERDSLDGLIRSEASKPRGSNRLARILAIAAVSAVVLGGTYELLRKFYFNQKRAPASEDASESVARPTSRTPFSLPTAKPDKGGVVGEIEEPKPLPLRDRPIRSGLDMPYGVNPPKKGIEVPPEAVLPRGFSRYYQYTDDGQPLPPILLYHPEDVSTEALEKFPDGYPLQPPEPEHPQIPYPNEESEPPTN